MMMRFVDYDLAMLLREKGYDGGCDAYYDNRIKKAHVL